MRLRERLGEKKRDVTIGVKEREGGGGRDVQGVNGGNMCNKVGGGGGVVKKRCWRL